MKRRHKVYLRLNLVSLLFVAVSFISVTLAWFAYSGLASIDTEVNVKAWYIELEKDGKEVSSDITISLDDIYPGMNTVTETVKIKNKGDSDAQISYKIESARLLDIHNFTVPTSMTSEELENKLSHNYPFHLNVNLNKKYTLAKTGESIFNVSISWPLDSLNDSLDSYWGSEAYKFQKAEKDAKALDQTYQIRPSIKVVISIRAEQYVESSTAPDVNYDMGKLILFNPVENAKCLTSGGNCLETTIIDTNNTKGDTTVTLLPNLSNISQKGSYENYDTTYNTITNGWLVNKRPLVIEDILKVISTDVKDSFLEGSNISNQIIGNLNNPTSISNQISTAIANSGMYTFSSNYNYLNSIDCYWLKSEYNQTSAFAIKFLNNDRIKAYGELKPTECKIVPVIIADKNKL